MVSDSESYRERFVQQSRVHAPKPRKFARDVYVSNRQRVQFRYDGRSLSEDGSTPTTFDENVAVTAKVVEMAHMVWV